MVQWRHPRPYFVGGAFRLGAIQTERSHSNQFNDFHWALVSKICKDKLWIVWVAYEFIDLQIKIKWFYEKYYVGHHTRSSKRRCQNMDFLIFSYCVKFYDSINGRIKNDGNKKSPLNVFGDVKYNKDWG